MNNGVNRNAAIYALLVLVESFLQDDPRIAVQDTMNCFAQVVRDRGNFDWMNDTSRSDGSTSTRVIDKARSVAGRPQLNRAKSTRDASGLNERDQGTKRAEVGRKRRRIPGVGWSGGGWRDWGGGQRVKADRDGVGESEGVYLRYQPFDRFDCLNWGFLLFGLLHGGTWEQCRQREYC